MIFEPLDQEAVDLLIDVVEWAVNEESLRDDLFAYANELLQAVA